MRCSRICWIFYVNCSSLFYFPCVISVHFSISRSLFLFFCFVRALCWRDHRKRRTSRVIVGWWRSWARRLTARCRLRNCSRSIASLRSPRTSTCCATPSNSCPNCWRVRATARPSSVWWDTRALARTRTHTHIHKRTLHTRKLVFALAKKLSDSTRLLVVRKLPLPRKISAAKQMAHTVFIDYLDENITIDAIKERLRPFGEVRYVSLPKRFVCVLYIFRNFVFCFLFFVLVCSLMFLTGAIRQLAKATRWSSSLTSALLWLRHALRRGRRWRRRWLAGACCRSWVLFCAESYSMYSTLIIFAFRLQLWISTTSHAMAESRRL